MNVPLGRAAKRWLLALLLVGFSALAVIAWVVVTRSSLRPNPSKPSSDSEDLDRWATLTAETLGTQDRRAQDRTGLAHQGKLRLDLPVPAVRTAFQAVPPPVVETSREEFAEASAGIIRGLRSLGRGAGGSIDAGQAARGD
jgi:hypothetical protein